MRFRGLAALTLACALSAAGQNRQIVRQVRGLVDAREFPAAEKTLKDARAATGVTATWIEAQSWMGRGYLAAKDYGKARAAAAETRRLALEALKGRELDAEGALPIALGASIEVEGQALAAQGQTAEAVAFLTAEMKTWGATSMRARIQKNLHLISLEGRPAPPLDAREFIGARPPSLESLKGRPVLLFFWAHWCGDCKAAAAAVARLARENSRLAVVGPTQTYGYAAGGAEVPRAEEIRHIGQIRERHYGEIPGMTVPLSEENFKAWGASTTPTLVLIDARGIVRMYHPGRMTYEELAAAARGL